MSHKPPTIGCVEVPIQPSKKYFIRKVEEQQIPTTLSKESISDWKPKDDPTSSIQKEDYIT